MLNSFHHGVKLLEIKVAAPVEVMISQELRDLSWTDLDAIEQEASKEFTLVDGPSSVTVEQLEDARRLVSLVELFSRIEVIFDIFPLVVRNLLVIDFIVSILLVVIIVAVVRIWREVHLCKANDTILTQEVEVRVANVVVWDIPIAPITP